MRVSLHSKDNIPHAHIYTRKRCYLDSLHIWHTPFSTYVGLVWIIFLDGKIMFNMIVVEHSGNLSKILNSMFLTTLKYQSLIKDNRVIGQWVYL